MSLSCVSSMDKHRTLDKFVHRKSSDKGSSTPFLCERCNKTIFGSQLFADHQKICSRWYCTVCSKTFHREDTFKKHLRLNCPPKRHQCSKCTATFSRASDKNTHEVKCQSQPKLKCLGCNTVFLTPQHLASHICDQLLSVSPGSQFNQTTPQTFVFLDLETTGLLSTKKHPQITEFCALAVHIETLQNPATKNLPRVVDKLCLHFHPTTLIQDGARQVTGICCHFS